jgi:hypothetical protein
MGAHKAIPGWIGAGCPEQSRPRNADLREANYKAVYGDADEVARLRAKLRDVSHAHSKWAATCRCECDACESMSHVLRVVCREPA